MNNVNPISEKANRVLAIIIVAFFLILLRVWFLTTFAHDTYVALSKIPQRKLFIDNPDRGTIRDRFNQPLAVNKIIYSVSILYDDIKQVPRIEWQKEKKKKKKIYKRKEYIEQLSKMLASKIDVEAQYIEDIIYSKASIFPNTPFILKENLSEEEYAKLKFLSKDWPGLHVDIRSKRYYPSHKLGCNIVGYLGKIHSEKYLEIHEEINRLSTALKDREGGLPIPLPDGFLSWKAVKKRYHELKEKSYTIHAQIGKSGIEKKFDEDLRGKVGRKKYEVSVDGKLLRVLPESTSSINGRRILLTISKELQEYAEQLLSENEKLRDERFRFAGKGHGNFLPPWIKGGSIVVMDPNTSEVLCAASYPRFDPNDFIIPENAMEENQSKEIHRWLETETNIHLIWEGSQNFKREIYEEKQGFYNEEKRLSWPLFLDTIVSLHSHVRKQCRKVTSLEQAALLLNTFETLLIKTKLSPLELIDLLYSDISKHEPISKQEKSKKIEDPQMIELSSILDELLLPIPNNYDKLLMLDLLKIVCPHRILSDGLIEKIGDWPIDKFFRCNQLLLQIKRELKKHLQRRFHEDTFAVWRKQHFKEFLKEKRLIEKKNKTYQKPYLDYLEQEEKRQFESYFKENFHRSLLKILTNYEDRITYGFSHPSSEELSSMICDLSVSQLHNLILSIRSLSELDSPLWGKYPKLGSRQTLEQDLAKRFYPISGFGFLRSHAYQEPQTPGSIYKIITSYEAIKQNYEKNHNLNPLIIFDEIKHEKIKNKGQILGYTADRKPITRRYKGGRLPKSHKSTGKLDFIRAFEHSSNIYFSLLASEVIENPKDLYNTSKDLSLSTKTGIDLPGENPGVLPDDLSDNKTGLYSFAIGQHSFTATPMQIAVMMSAFANDGKVFKPQIVKTIANIEPDPTTNIFDLTNYPYKQYLASIGIYFPFFSEALKEKAVPYVHSMHLKVNKQINLHPEVKKYLHNALYRVVNGREGNARTSVIRMLYGNSELRKRYIENSPYLVGKTATAEVAFKPTFDREIKPIIAKHIWFSGISFKDKERKEPELAIVVYLKFGDYGKECAPLASEMISKWREIVKKYSQD